RWFELRGNCIFARRRGGHGQVEADARAPGAAAGAARGENRMTVFGCAAARRRLQAYHDGELPVGDQIAVAAHVDRCRACAETLAELRTLTSAMRSVGGMRHGLTREQAAAFQSAVVSRAKAERDASFVARVRGMFD